MLLGEELTDEKGLTHKMAGILPFKSRKGKLSIGYRFIKGERDSLLINKNQEIKGHEFHYWQIFNELNKCHNQTKIDNTLFSSPWEIKSWGTEFKNEGWSDEKLHASWIHLHLPSSPEVAKNFIDATQISFSRDY